MEVLIPVVAALVAGAVGVAIGRSSGRDAGVQQSSSAGDARLRALVEALKRGRLPSDLPPGSPEAELGSALEQGWAPRESERQAALREAIGRVSSFLDKNVRTPLNGVRPDESADQLRDRIERALGSLQDLDFFVREAALDTQGTDLASLVQRVSKEFVNDQGLGVRLMLGDAQVRASVDPTALMDALYLVLHNASRFGKSQTVDMTVVKEGAQAKIVVRDRGEGFSEEAFRRAFDPFYSTADDGLGLGLPHARKVIEGMGGEIELRNVPDGGAEVELSFPAA